MPSEEYGADQDQNFVDRIHYTEDVTDIEDRSFEQKYWNFENCILGV